MTALAMCAVIVMCYICVCCVFVMLCQNGQGFYFKHFRGERYEVSESLQERSRAPCLSVCPSSVCPSFVCLFVHPLFVCRSVGHWRHKLTLCASLLLSPRSPALQEILSQQKFSLNDPLRAGYRAFCHLVFVSIWTAPGRVIDNQQLLCVRRRDGESSDPLTCLLSVMLCCVVLLCCAMLKRLCNG